MENIYGPWGNGVEAFLKRDYTTAERCFRSASPSSKICFNLGMSMMVQFRFQEAIDAFNQALEFDDWMAISYFQRGNCLFMLGQYDNAILSWYEAKENIRHGEVVDYDSLHLSYMLCKSEIAVNIGIAFYYCDMTDECNMSLDEARGYTIVKDDIPAVTQQMIAGEEIYPCTVDDTTLFNPPKLPQSVIDAMKKGSTNSWGSSPSPPSYSSSPPSYSSSPPAPTSYASSAKLAPPARTAPAPAPGKKSGFGSPGSSSGPSSPSFGSPNTSGPPPPPPPKKAPKKGFGKMGPKKSPAGMPQLSSSPPPFGAPSSAKSPGAPPTPSWGGPSPTTNSNSGPGAPAPPPIPSGGIPQRAIPASGGNESSQASASRTERPGPPLPFSAASLQDALTRRGGANNTSQSPIEKSGANSTNTTTTQPRFGLSNSGGSRPSPTMASTPKSNTSGPMSLKMPVRAAPAPTSRPAAASVSQAQEPNPISPRGGTVPGGAFSFKILAEQGIRKKKIETSVSSPQELREQIAQAFGVDSSTLIEHYDPDFGEFVELDNGVNLSSLPTMLKARVQ